MTLIKICGTRFFEIAHILKTNQITTFGTSLTQTSLNCNEKYERETQDCLGFLSLCRLR